MSLLNKLISGQASATSLSGQTPKTPNFQQSTLHYDYSTIGKPNASQVEPNNGVLPSPSLLDRGSSLSTRQNYLERLPR